MKRVYERVQVYEVRPRRDKRGVDLISDALSFGRLWYAEPELDSISCHKLFVAQGIMADPLTFPPLIVIEKLLAAIQLWEGLQR